MPTEQYPSNAKTVRAKEEEQPTEKHIRKVVDASEVTRRKKPIHKRILHTFFGQEDAAGVASHITTDVVVPAVKELIVNTIISTAERAFFGENAPVSRRGGRYGSRIDYAGIASRTLRGEPQTRTDRGEQRKTLHDFEEVVLPSLAAAEAVLEEMFEVLSQFDIVTVADLYGMLGQSSSFTDQKYGWEGPGALGGARAVRISGGEYLLDLPRPSYIK